MKRLGKNCTLQGRALRFIRDLTIVGVVLTWMVLPSWAIGAWEQVPGQEMEFGITTLFGQLLVNDPFEFEVGYNGAWVIAPALEPNLIIGQTFVASSTGTLARISLRLSRSNDAAGSFEVSINEFNTTTGQAENKLASFIGDVATLTPDLLNVPISAFDVSGANALLIANRTYIVVVSFQGSGSLYAQAATDIYPGGSFFRCFCFAPPEGHVVVNNLVSFEAIPPTFHFTPDPTGCPAGFVGTFSFEARLTNISEHSVTDLVVMVITLTNGNLLQNANGGPEGVGALLTVPQQDEFTDGVLGPDELVDVPFLICLRERQPFQFMVDVFGIVDAGADTQIEALFMQDTRTGAWAPPPE
jgi:hypothetical protein